MPTQSTWVPSFMLLRTRGKCKFVFNPLIVVTNCFTLLSRSQMITESVMWLSSRLQSRAATTGPEGKEVTKISWASENLQILMKLIPTASLSPPPCKNSCLARAKEHTSQRDHYRHISRKSEPRLWIWAYCIFQGGSRQVTALKLTAAITRVVKDANDI